MCDNNTRRTTLILKVQLGVQAAKHQSCGTQCLCLSTVQLSASHKPNAYIAWQRCIDVGRCRRAVARSSYETMGMPVCLCCHELEKQSEQYCIAMIAAMTAVGCGSSFQGSCLTGSHGRQLSWSCQSWFVRCWLSVPKYALGSHTVITHPDPGTSNGEQHALSNQMMRKIMTGS